jgi:hypothetical protein
MDQSISNLKIRLLELDISCYGGIKETDSVRPSKSRKPPYIFIIRKKLDINTGNGCYGLDFCTSKGLMHLCKADQIFHLDPEDEVEI